MPRLVRGTHSKGVSVSLISLIIAIAILLIGVVFAILNATPVTFNYLFGTYAFSLSFLLVLSFIAGFIFASLTLFWHWCVTRQSVYTLRRRQRMLEAELAALRSKLVKDDD